MAPTIEKLPQELIEKIANNLNFEDLKSLSICNRFLNQRLKLYRLILNQIDSGAWILDISTTQMVYERPAFAKFLYRIESIKEFEIWLKLLEFWESAFRNKESCPIDFSRRSGTWAKEFPLPWFIHQELYGSGASKTFHDNEKYSQLVSLESALVAEELLVLTKRIVYIENVEFFLKSKLPRCVETILILTISRMKNWVHEFVCTACESNMPLLLSELLVNYFDLLHRNQVSRCLEIAFGTNNIECCRIIVAHLVQKKAFLKLASIYSLKCLFLDCIQCIIEADPLVLIKVDALNIIVGNGDMKLFNLLKGIPFSKDQIRRAFGVSCSLGHAETMNAILNAWDCCILDNGLKIAMEFKNWEIVDILLQHNQCNPAFDDNYPLKYCAEQNMYNFLNRLMGDERVDPTTNDNYPFMVCVRKGYMESIRILLQNQRIRNHPSTGRAIGIAAACGHLEIVKYFIQLGLDPQFDNNYALHLCCEKNAHEACRLLLELGCDPSALNNYAVRAAARNGGAQVLGILLQDYRVDPEANFNEPIVVSSTFGHLECVRVLLADGRADPSVPNNEAIKMAARNEHWAIVMDLSFCPNVDITAAFQIALDSQNVEVVRILMEHPHVNLQAIRGCIAIFCIRNQCNDKLMFLFQSGYKPKWGALIAAVRKKNYEAIKTLFKYFDYEFREESKEALAIAVQNQHSYMVRVLLSYGVDHSLALEKLQSDLCFDCIKVFISTAKLDRRQCLMLMEEASRRNEINIVQKLSKYIRII
jgi:ankyrin repeat protein